jgi:hypothetical protein
MAIQAIGRDLWATALGSTSGATGTTTSSPTATTVTDTGQAWTTNQWEGRDVIVGGVVGTVVSNTGTVLTISRWETPGVGTRSGSAASTPASGTYVICSGQAPAQWMALTANSSSPTTGGGDTTLTAEITTAGGALIRKGATWAHTTGTNTYTLSNTYTANSSDSLPVTLAKIGIFNAKTSGRLLFETLLSSTATLTTEGDSVTITDTVTGT